MDPAESPASRLCAQCGLCCNGVMFHRARLQPGETPRQFAVLGLRLERKKREYYLPQPCAAHTGAACGIYESRPERCRLFVCMQLRRIAAGGTTEAAALEKIRDAKSRAAALDALLRQAGPTDVTQPLSKRCDRVSAEPPDPADPGAVALHALIAQAMGELDAILDADFRVPKEKE